MNHVYLLVFITVDLMLTGKTGAFFKPCKPGSRLHCDSNPCLNRQGNVRVCYLYNRRNCRCKDVHKSHFFHSEDYRREQNNTLNVVDTEERHAAHNRQLGVKIHSFTYSFPIFLSLFFMYLLAE